jgi:hypothetical protein
VKVKKEVRGDAKSEEEDEEETEIGASGQVRWLEGVRESHDIQYCQEIDSKRDPGIKHNFYVGDHVLVFNGHRVTAYWYRPGSQDGHFIDSEEDLHAEVTRLTRRDCVYLLNTHQVKFWRSPKVYTGCQPEESTVKFSRFKQY